MRKICSGPAERRSHPIALRGLFAAWLLTACGPEPIEFGSLASAIVDGTPSNKEAVIALFGDHHLMCSGVLVAEDVVLTAAHCLLSDPFDKDSEFDQLSVVFGNDAHVPIARRVVNQTWSDPAWNALYDAHDIAVLWLEAAAPVPPMPIVDPSLEPLRPGEQVRVLGYGSTKVAGDAAGVRLEQVVTIRTVDDATLTIGPPVGPCFADSGGPLIVERESREFVAGLSARSDCATKAVFTALSSYGVTLKVLLQETAEREQYSGVAETAMSNSAVDAGTSVEAQAGLTCGVVGQRNNGLSSMFALLGATVGWACARRSRRRARPQLFQ